MDLITVVLLLQLAYRIDKAYAGTELQPQSLQCTNDYLREMVCTWDAGLKVNCNTDYTLQYQKTAGSKKGTCFPNNFRVDPEREGLSAQCICRFAVPGFDSTDEYKVEVCSDGRGVMNSTIRVSETIKTAAPHILSVVEDEGKNLTLLWNSRYSKNEPLQELLMFEVMYRKRDSLTEEYEKIEELGAVKHKIPWLSLETGNQYIFRVRAKLDMFNATWSDWSPVDIKPKGILICYNDYIDEMVCVWNASMQINCSGEYTLSFTRLRLPFKNDSCVLRNVGVGPNSLSTRCECKMPKLADGFVVHDMYIVEVWHRENAILLTHVFPCETIKPRPPHNLSVSRSEKNNFNLTWKIGSNVNEKMDFQVSLRKKEEPDEKAQLINVSDVSLEIIRSYLDPGHSYVVKVRSFSREYHSQYSDWSLEVEWQNYHTAALYLLKIATPIVCVSLLVVIISCYLCTRIAKLKLHDNKIPNPAKSTLIFHSEKSQLLFLPSAFQDTISSLEIEGGANGKPTVKPWVHLFNLNLLCEKSAPEFCSLDDDYDQTSTFMKQTAGEQHQAVETAPEYQGCPFSCDATGYYPGSINTYTSTHNRSDEEQPLGFESLMQGFQAGAAGSNVKIGTRARYTSVDSCPPIESKNSPEDLGIDGQDSPLAGLTAHGWTESLVKDLRGSGQSLNSCESGYKNTPYSWVSVKQETALQKASSPGLVLNVISHECPHLNRAMPKWNDSAICCDLSYKTLESLVHEPAPDQSVDNATVQQLPNQKTHLKPPVPPAFCAAPVKDSLQLSSPAVVNIYEYQSFESCVAHPLPNQNSRLPASVSQLGSGLSVNKEAWEPVNCRLPSPRTVKVIDGYQSYDALAGIIQSGFSRTPAAESRQIENSTDQGSSADSLISCDQAYKSVHSLLEMTARELPFVKTMEQDGNVEDRGVDSFPILDFTASNLCVSECQTIQSTGAKGEAMQAPSDFEPGNST